MKPPSRGAWRCKRGRRGSLSGRADEAQRWQSRRAETVLAATVGHRHAAAAALDGKRKGVIGTLAAPAAAPTVSHSEARIAHYHLATPPPRGRVMRPWGEIDRASRPRGPAARGKRTTESPCSRLQAAGIMETCAAGRRDRPHGRAGRRPVRPGLARRPRPRFRRRLGRKRLGAPQPPGHHLWIRWRRLGPAPPHGPGVDEGRTAPLPAAHACVAPATA